MKIQCDVCEKAEAALLCCADEAALCWGCDERVHAANKLAGKHQRLPLFTPNPATASASAQMPSCDICQEKAGYFFCLEDRALLCRNCDLGIHTVSAYSSSHQRFLITGVRVAVQHYLPNNSKNSNNNYTSKSNNSNNDRSNGSSSNGNSSNHKILTDKNPWTTPSLSVGEGEGLGAEWMWDGVFDSAEFSQCNGISEPGSSS